MQSRIIDPKELVKKNPVLQHINLSLCVECKAVKSLCGLAKCPLLDALDVYPDKDRITELKSNVVFGPSAQIFVGSQGYPRVNSGPLTSIIDDPDLAKLTANPAKWTDLQLKDIIELRYGLVRGRRNMYIKPFKSEKIAHQLQQLSMSIEAVDIEGLYASKPTLGSTFSIETQPMGPSGTLNRLDIASNPKIPKKVDYILGDELTSQEQMNKLYGEKFDVYYLQNVFSAGLTGREDAKKIVPTRWSITATDDILGKELIPNLVDYPWIKDIEVRYGSLLGNNYTIILLPGRWTFENFEAWMAGGIFTIGNDNWSMSYEAEGFTNKEFYKGRTSYASQAGGYYATRLAVLEHLHQRREQAKAIVIREITSDYVVPVGVWQVREGMRKAVQNLLYKLQTKEEVKRTISHLNIPIKKYLSKSQTFIQTSLDDFF